MIRTSGKLTLAAFTAMTASPAPGSGDATSSTTSDSGGPYALQRTAFTRWSLSLGHDPSAASRRAPGTARHAGVLPCRRRCDDAASAIRLETAIHERRDATA